MGENRTNTKAMIKIFLTLLFSDLGHVQVAGSARRYQGIESGRFMFYFDGESRIFVGSNSLTCILVPLNKHEIDDVHTTNGLAKIELKMLREWLGFLPEVNVLRSDPNLSRQILHWCNTKDIILLQRTNNSGPIPDSTTVSPQPNTFSESDRVSTVLPSDIPTSNVNPTTGNKEIMTSLYQMTSSSTQGHVEITTTSEIPASATSQHARMTTTPGVYGPYVIYDKSANGSMNAVIVDKDFCYVYHLTETDIHLVNMGSDIRNAFEKALLLKDRSHTTKNDMYIHEANIQIQQMCRGDVFKFL